jgi:alpha-L-rhamnosidase
MIRSGLQAINLTCDYKPEPIGIGSEKPLLRWMIGPENTREGQIAYRIAAASAINLLDTSDLWDSGRIESPKQQAEYGGKTPASGQRVYWRVMVWGSGQGKWSNAASWKQGIGPHDWRGQWIGNDEGRDAYDRSIPYYCADDYDKGENHPFLPPPPLLRQEFSLTGDEPVCATLYVSALGLASVQVNGTQVTGPMVPGICDYRKRAYYLTYDVTGLMRAGVNAIGAVLADGWYSGYIGLNPREFWGSKPRLALELITEYRDGSSRHVITDAEWKTARGPYLYADILHGTGYDARLLPAGWTLPGFDDTGWRAADTGAEYSHTPSAYPGVPIEEHERFPVQELSCVGQGRYIADFGQCFAGVVCLKLKGKAGGRVEIRHAEELKDGELYLRGNRSAQARDTYILSGEGQEEFMPPFTYHGFRYAEITLRDGAELVSAEGIALGSGLPYKTAFNSDNQTVNTVYRMIARTQASNQFDMPTDVCARDERLGWGAEGHFFMHTAAYLNNNALFLRKWMADIADGQADDGCFWANAPAVMMADVAPFAGDLQSDMGIHCCWLLYTMYNDTQCVRAYFPALERQFAFALRNSDRLIRFAIGRDWLDLGSDGRTDADHGYGECPPGLLGTAYFARSAQMMQELADGLGLCTRSAYYAEMYLKIRAAFRTFFVMRNRHLRGATQGGWLAATEFGLLDADELLLAREWVRKDMADRGITWGTATTPIALSALCRLGLSCKAAEFIAGDGYPGIGYMASQGATAVWERWDSRYEGRFHPHPMNAFNHIGLATVGSWLVASLAGIAPGAPGFRTVLLAPMPNELIGGASARYQSLFGPVAAGWKVNSGGIACTVSIPAGTKGVFRIPEGYAADAKETEGMTKRADGTLELTPGNYCFQLSRRG